MLLFTRQATIRPGQLTEALGFITEITAFASDRLGQEIACHIVTFGAPQGTVVWTAAYESVAAQSAAQDQLLADPDYLQRVDDGGGLWLPGSFRDMLRDPVVDHGLDGPTAYSVFTTATPAPGKLRQAIDWGADMAGFVHQVTGQPTAFYSDMFGRHGKVSWITGFPDAAAMDTARSKYLADPGYLDRLEQAGDAGLFNAGSGRSSMTRRIA